MKSGTWAVHGGHCHALPGRAFFGYHFVYPGSLDFLFGYGKQFTPMVTINEYCDLFMTVILGMGASFELPVLVYFLALFGIVTPKWLWKNIKYAILVIVIIAARSLPRRIPLRIRLRYADARPLPARYSCRLSGPSFAARSKEAGGRILIRRFCLARRAAVADSSCACAIPGPVQRRKGARICTAVCGLRAALQRQRRAALAQNYLKKQFAHDNLQADTFVASTPAGPQQMTNFIVRFPGKKDGVIVLATHYETNYSLRKTSFVGANDGAATTGLLLEIANHLRGRTLDGYSVWLVFFDGEESVVSMDPTPTRSTAAGIWRRSGRSTAR